MQIARINIITDSKAYAETVATIGKRGKALDKLIHRAAVSAIYHAREFGDVRKFEALCEAMPKGSRVKALVAWYEAHVPVDADDEGNRKLKKGRTADDFKIEDAAKTPFWEFTKERAPVALTLEKLMEYVEKRIEKLDDLQDEEARAILLQGIKAAADSAAAKQLRLVA